MAPKSLRGLFSVWIVASGARRPAIANLYFVVVDLSREMFLGFSGVGSSGCGVRNDLNGWSLFLFAGWNNNLGLCRHLYLRLPNRCRWWLRSRLVRTPMFFGPFLFFFRFNLVLPCDVSLDNALLRHANQYRFGPVGLRSKASAVARPLADFHGRNKGIRKFSQIAQDHVLIVIHDFVERGLSK